MIRRKLVCVLWQFIDNAPISSPLADFLHFTSFSNSFNYSSCSTLIGGFSLNQNANLELLNINAHSWFYQIFQRFIILVFIAVSFVWSCICCYSFFGVACCGTRNSWRTSSSQLFIKSLVCCRKIQHHRCHSLCSFLLLSSAIFCIFSVLKWLHLLVGGFPNVYCYSHWKNSRFAPRLHFPNSVLGIFGRKDRRNFS